MPKVMAKVIDRQITTDPTMVGRRSVRSATTRIVPDRGGDEEGPQGVLSPVQRVLAADATGCGYLVI